MVVLIFEGVDNLGKSTIISKLTDRYKGLYDVVLMHASAPQCREGEDPFEIQKRRFSQAFAKCSSLAMQEFVLVYNNKNLVFMDRSHIGEYVYGQIYRNGDPEKIMEMIKDIHNKHLYFTSVVVHLEASPEFVIKHDDNNSFTSGYDSEKRLKTVKKEIDLFNECFEKLHPLNYMKINVETVDGNYRDIDNICDEIISNLKEMNIELA